MPADKIRIGTRGSKLALVQTGIVKKALEAAHPGLAAELVTITTRGDRLAETPFADIAAAPIAGVTSPGVTSPGADTGLFIREIEHCLLHESIDIAVHSLKDLPSDLPAELDLGAVLQRGDARDALISARGKTLGALPRGAIIATSSLRRRAQLLHHNPAANIVDIRGNIDTRLRKMSEGFCDALVLAACGLIRAGYAHMITEYLDPGLMIPAVCQGIIGIEIRRDDEHIESLVKAINHETTFIVARAERELMRKLEGGCRVPLGCSTNCSDGRIDMTAMLSDVNGNRLLKKTLSGPLHKALLTAHDLAEQMLSAGGREILDSVRRVANEGRS